MAKNSLKLVILPSDYPAFVESVYCGRCQIVDYVKNYIRPSHCDFTSELELLSHTACSMARLKLASLASQGVVADVYSNLFSENFWLKKAIQLDLPF